MTTTLPAPDPAHPTLDRRATARIMKKAKERADLLRHFSQGIEALDASLDGDHCIHESERLTDAQKALEADQVRMSNAADAYQQDHDNVQKYKKNYKRSKSAERQDYWLELWGYAQESETRDSKQMEAIRKDIDKDEEDVKQATEDLKQCRKNHPLDGECGSRGGVGVRRPDGKCAGWEDWRAPDGGYY